VRVAASAREQCFTWGPQQHHSKYDRIVDVAMRYSAVVNYEEAVEIPLLLRHPASSSSSTSTTASQPTPLTLAGGFSAPTAQLRAVTVCFPRRRYFQWTFSINARNCCVFLLYYILIVQGDRCSFRQPGLDSRRRRHIERQSFR
jgi:hypothetical protein